jgi:hypothetical protein
MCGDVLACWSKSHQLARYNLHNMDGQRTCPLEPIHMTIPPNEYDPIHDQNRGNSWRVNLSPACDPRVFLKG